MLTEPARWPFRVVLPLAHTTRTDELGSPRCAVLAYGHGPTLFLANVGDFERLELQSRSAFELALTRFETVCYISFDAILKDGWRVD